MSPSTSACHGWNCPNRVSCQMHMIDPATQPWQRFFQPAHVGNQCEFFVQVSPAGATERKAA